MTDAAPPVAVLSYRGPSDGQPPGRRRLWSALGIAGWVVAVVTFGFAGLMTVLGGASAYRELTPLALPARPVPRPLTVAETYSVLASPSITGAQLTPAQLDGLGRWLRSPNQHLLVPPVPPPGSSVLSVRSHTPTRIEIAGSNGYMASPGVYRFEGSGLVLDADGHFVAESSTTFSPDGLVTTTTDATGKTTTAVQPLQAAGRPVRIAAAICMSVASAGNAAAAVLLAVAATCLLRPSASAPLWCRRFAVCQWVVAAAWSAATVGLFVASRPPSQPYVFWAKELVVVGIGIVACLFPAVLWRAVGRRPAGA